MNHRHHPALVFLAVAATLLFVATACQGNQAEIDDLEEANAGLTSDKAALESQVLKLSYNTASGGGVNLKRMPHPETGEATAEMPEVFSFDRNHAICRVDTNPVAFVMPTHSMGEVTIEANRFFMGMSSTSIDSYEVSTLGDGSRQVVMRGGLDCVTEVGVAELVFGDRNVAEHATYRVTAVDGGVGGGSAGDKFEYTVFFDENEAPLNYAIFGPEFTFTGQMIDGEVTIVDPNA